MAIQWAHTDSTFLYDRREGGRYGPVVWRYRVVVVHDGERFSEIIDVWNPRWEPDANGEGYVSLDAEWDRLTLSSGVELSEEEGNTFNDAVRELVRNDLAEAY